jgi:hypothetical protein
MEKIKSHFTQHGIHYAAVLIFYAIAAMFFSKSFDGYVVRQGDIEGYIGMSKEARDSRVLFDNSVGWTNAMFGGMPTTQINPDKAPFDAVSSIRRFINSLTGFGGITVFLLAMIGGYLLAIALGASPWIALLCGVGIGLSTFEVLYFSAGHNSKVHAIAYMPSVLAGVIWAYRKNLWIGAAIAALGTGLHIASGHPQMTYYLLFLLVGIGLTEVYRIGVLEKDWSKALRISGILLAAGIAGVLPRATHLLETKSYAKHTIRGEQILFADAADESRDVDSDPGLDRSYILEYSMADGEWWSIMSPNIKGGNSPYYWGEQSSSGGAFYFGSILVALFFMFLVAGRDRLRWPLLAITFVTILLSRRSGGWLTDFFLDYIPLFNKFRDTKMMLILVLLTVAMGAALGLKEMIQSIESKEGMAKRQRNLWLGSLGALMATFAAFYLIPEVFFDFQSSIRPDRAVAQLGYSESLARRLEIFRPDVLRTLGLLAILAAVVSAMVWKKLKPTWGVVILVAVTTVDLWQVDHRYFNDDSNWVKKVDHAFPFSPSAKMMQLLEKDFSKTPENQENAERLYASYLERMGDVRLTRNEKVRLRVVSQFGAMRFASPYRILRWENPFNDSSTSYFFQSVGGYHAAKLRRYQDFIERVLMPERERLVEALQSGQDQSAFGQLIGLRMLNTRYILFENMQDPVPVPGCPGAAWVATDWTWAANDNDEMEGTVNLNDPRSAVIHVDFEDEMQALEPGASGRVELTDYALDFLAYDAELDQAGLLVFSEIWYPEGWEAQVDGEPVETVRVNYILRGLKVPAGSHEITWTFVQEKSNALEVVVNLIFVLFVLGAAWRGFKLNHEEIKRV